jgi:hypothetical protein
MLNVFYAAYNLTDYTYNEQDDYNQNVMINSMVTYFEYEFTPLFA